jgi:hypothetical protein
LGSNDKILVLFYKIVIVLNLFKTHFGKLSNILLFEKHPNRKNLFIAMEENVDRIGKG